MYIEELYLGVQETSGLKADVDRPAGNGQISVSIRMNIIISSMTIVGIVCSNNKYHHCYDYRGIFACPRDRCGKIR